MKRLFWLLTALVGALPLRASDPSAMGNQLVADYFRNETRMLSEHCLAEIHSPADWSAHRDEYRRQLQEMLGLWPLPKRTELKAVTTGKLEAAEFAVEKLQFQASPGLYCTANLFVPKNLTQPAPTVLYACGHWRLVTNGISYGNKAVYQVDGAWFARNGYVCLVLDTLLSGEIQGIHTGTRDRGMWWWNSRGYTPAGVEAWFGMRALDYLSTRPEVDTNRFGITGHSGGGAYSWTVTALDDRIKVAAPLAGMADLQCHIGDGVLDSHCDCNFPINIYRWDFPQLAALAAPRPLLIGGTDNDRIFPLTTTLRIHEKVKRIYTLNNAADKLGLVIAPGPHDEVPELRLAVLRWFDRYLKGTEPEAAAPMGLDARKFFTPEQLRVFSSLPADAVNTNAAISFVPLAKSPPPKSLEGLREALREKVFAGWPSDDLPLEPRPAFSVEREGVRFSAWDFLSQHDVPLRIYFLERAGGKPAELVRLTVLGEVGWTNWLGAMRQRYESVLRDEIAVTGGSSEKAVASFSPTDSVALAFIAPRGVGLNAFTGDEKAITKIRRRYMLLGQTLEGMRVWDVRRAVQMIHFVREGDVAKVEIQADGNMARNALYAGVFEPSVRRLEIGGLPASAFEGPDYLGVQCIVSEAQLLEILGTKVHVQ